MLQTEYITLNQACTHIPGRPSLSTVHRWATRGIKGVRLDAVRIGGRIFTTADAVERFLQSQAAVGNPTHAEADAELTTEGI